jgi:signal transduction histidine kinase/CheY-like chemotaxis protein
VTSLRVGLLEDRFRRASRVCSVLVVLLGATGLAGWVFDIQRLKSVSPSFVSMKANTAVLLIVLGASLLPLGRLRAGFARRWMALFLASIAALTLAQNFIRVNVGIDELLFKDQSFSVHSGRMAPATGYCFLLLGIAIFLADLSKARQVRQAMALSSAFLAFLAVCGYMYGVESLYSIAPYETMAVHTAIALLLASLAFLFAAPDEGLMRIFTEDTQVGLLARRLYPVIVVIPLISGGLFLLALKYGLYDVPFGIAVSAMKNIGALVLTSGWIVSSLRRSEKERLQVQADLAITQRLREEESGFHRAQDELAKSQQMESIGRLAAGIAHDFNNLLTVIHGRSELALSSEALDPSTRDHLQQIMLAGNQAAALTGRFLAFGRKQMLQPKVVDLCIVVTQLGVLLRPLAGEDIRLEVTSSPLPVLTMADPSQVEQIIMHLATNARDAMPRGGVLSITVGQTTILAKASMHCDGAEPGRYAYIEVADTGGGIEAAIRAQIFEPYFTTKDVGKGTGLGLPTVYSIVKQSGGSIELESEPGRGTRFRVYLPLVEGDSPGLMQAAPGAVERGGESILVVEDEDSVRSVVVKFLRNRGYSVVEACTGEQALREFADHSKSIDLIVSDIRMPGMKGPELCAKLSRLSPSLRVLFISGYTDDLSILGSGAAFLQKPFNLAALQGKVREVLDLPDALRPSWGDSVGSSIAGREG